MRRDLHNQSAKRENVLPAALVADVRHRVHSREIRRWQESEERADVGETQRRRGSQGCGTDARDNLRAKPRRPGAEADSFAEPRKPGAVPEYLGRGEGM